MARNRKRSRERRTGRPDAPAQPGVAATRARAQDHGEADEAPPALEHASPDVELAEAQLAVGRPAEPQEPSAPDLEEQYADEEGEVPAGPPARREPTGTRLVNFVQGSWRELQRVQWPDRRQVMQATGVVIGFVIVAGAYLGVADALASKIVNLILK